MENKRMTMLHLFNESKHVYYKHKECWLIIINRQPFLKKPIRFRMTKNSHYLFHEFIIRTKHIKRSGLRTKLQ